MDTPYILLAFNIVLSIAAFFGGMTMRDLSTAVKELRTADKELTEKLGNYTTRDELRDIRMEQKETLREMREENRAMFQQVFEKLDSVQQQVAGKADRHEARG